MTDLILIILLSITGLLVGCITGLIPGLHVNTISMLLLSSVNVFIMLLNWLTEKSLLLMGVFIVSVSITHTFVNIIPATFLGAPDEDESLSVLPAHKMLLNGQGYEAVVFSALGSFGALLIGVLLIIPIKIILSEPLNFYETINENMFWVLLAVVLLMLGTEKPKHGKKLKNYIQTLFAATLTVLLSGVFGLIILDLPVNSPFSLSSSILFPALAGLFGMSTQIHSLRFPTPIQKQNIEDPHLKPGERKKSFVSILTGTLAGSFVSIIPGVTPATGTIIALTARGETDTKQVIITLSAVNTVNAILTLALLFTLHKTRSGVIVTLSNLLPVEEWTRFAPPVLLIHLLIPIIVAGSLAYPLTCFLGKKVAKHIDLIPYNILVKTTIVALTTLTFIFTGLTGLAVLFVATTIGLLPITFGVRRSHCMGILILPLMLHFLPT
ncbi:MAG: tripartite tricarboxylate transporter permease [Thermoplasmata archaeon]|nr:tripartite tricarboxylate transporter permease [Thermoplasmata archaeon]